MAIALALVTLAAVIVIGLGLRRLRALVAAGVTGSSLTPAAVMVFGGVAVASVGIAIIPFTFSGHVGDGLALTVAGVQAALLVVSVAIGLMTGGVPEDIEVA